MGFEVIHSKKPSYSLVAAAVIIILSVVLLGISVLFAYLFITGKGTNHILGTMLSLEFLIAGVILILFLKYFIVFRKVSEDREEELLW